MPSVRPILAYAYPVWHTNPAKEQKLPEHYSETSNEKVIFDSNCNDYDNFCLAYKLDTS